MSNRSKNTPPREVRETKEELDNGFAAFRSALITEYKELTGREWCKEEPRQIGYHSIANSREKR